MSKISIESRQRSVNPDAEEVFHRFYNAKGELKEVRLLSGETDYYKGAYIRTSTDHGKTWSEWETRIEDDGAHHTVLPGNEFGDEYEDWCKLGEDIVDDNENADQVSYGLNSAPTLFHKQSGCYVCVGTSRYMMNGRKGYYQMWEDGADTIRTHAYFAFRRPDGTEVKRLFEFEEGGADFDPNNHRNPAFLDKNRAYPDRIRILPDGDLLTVLVVNMRLCCKLAGVDVNTFFPSCPDLQSGIVIARGRWNPETQDFDFTYSNPIMISDLQSSRGFMEPQLAILESGRMVLVVRGSNFIYEPWHTRISPAAPSFKWFATSDDGGRTFTPAMPWHFDTREVIYSPASISSFFRSKKNGKLYWIGNVYDDPSNVYANDPRNILQICEVDDTHGHLIKETMQVIDTVREGQTDVELSNFSIVENRETLNLELRLAKIDIDGKLQDDGFWYSEAWEYIIHFEE